MTSTGRNSYTSSTFLFSESTIGDDRQAGIRVTWPCPRRKDFVDWAHNSIRSTKSPSSRSNNRRVRSSFVEREGREPIAINNSESVFYEIYWIWNPNQKQKSSIFKRGRHRRITVHSPTREICMVMMKIILFCKFFETKEYWTAISWPPARRGNTIPGKGGPCEQDVAEFDLTYKGSDRCFPLFSRFFPPHCKRVRRSGAH